MKLWGNLVFTTAILVIAIGAAQFLLPAAVAPTFNLVIGSLFAALSAFGSLLTIREMRHDRTERSRPFILVDFYIGNSLDIQWRVRNVGGGPATNITFAFNPEPVDSEGRKLTDIPFFQNPLPILVPGSDVQQYLDTYPALANSGYPTAYRMTVCYDWEGGKGECQSYQLDIRRFEGLIAPSKTTVEALEDIDKHLKELTSSLRKVTAHNKLRIELHEKQSIQRVQEQAQDLAIENSDVDDEVKPKTTSEK